MAEEEKKYNLSYSRYDVDEAVRRVKNPDTTPTSGHTTKLVTSHGVAAKISELSDSVNTQVTQIGSKLGDLTQLETEEKTNLVDAINEVMNNASSTAEKTTYEDNYGIGADNVQDAVDNIAKSFYVDRNEEPVLGGWGNSTSSSSFVDNGGHNVTITIKKSSAGRIGFEVTNAGAGTELHISYNFTKTTSKAGGWGIGSSLTASWKNISPTSGSIQFPSDLSGKMEFSFLIPSGTTYIFLSTYSFYDGGPQTLEIANFKAWSVEKLSFADLAEKTELGDLDELATDAKSNIVDAVNELDDDIKELGGSIAIEDDEENNLDAWQYGSGISLVDNGNHNAVITVNASSAGRVGFKVNSAEGSELHISYHIEKTTTKGGSWAIGSAFNSAWSSITATSGTAANSSGVTSEDVEFSFIVPSGTCYIYMSGSNYYASGAQTLTITEFKAWTTVGISELRDEIETLEGYAFQPSSYIPIKEGYESYMSVAAHGTGQGSAVYGDYFVQGFTYAGSIKIYDMSAKTLVQTVDMPTISNNRTHANTMSFSGTKYDSGDDFPLLYVCSGYTNSTSSSTSHVYVVRIAGTRGSWTTELIQTITLDFGLVNRWTEWVCDPVNSRAWINGSGIDKYICVAIPDISESAVTINAETPIIDHFNTKTFALGLSTKSSGQGRFFYHNRVYWVSGVPSYEGEGDESLYVVVDNTLTHCTEAVVPLKNFGLSSGTSDTYEPEGCFIWNDEFYVAYRTFIAKLIQN